MSASAQGQVAPPPSTKVHIVGAGQDRFGPVHSLGFSSLAFKVGTEEAGGGLFVIEHTNLMPGGGPPLHVHPHQEEFFYVMEGEVVFQVGPERAQLHTGECILAPRAVPHTFSALEKSHMLIAFSPAGKMEDYFRDAEQHKDLAATPDFIRRYDMEWIGPSPFWKR